MDICAQKRPPDYVIGENHYSACFLYRDHPVKEESTVSTAAPAMAT